MRARFRVLLVLAVLAVLFGTAGPYAYSAFVDTTAKDRIEADPPPALFPASDVRGTARDVAAQQAPAERLMQGWWRDHDARPHDAEFVAWLEKTLPGPPSSREREREVRQVQRLGVRRTDALVTASTWLENYGKKDVWKLYAHDVAEMLPASTGDTRKNDMDALLSMTKDVADTLGARYQQSAPYVLHPDLRPDHTVTKGQVCPCSYPSRHAAAGAAARVFLDAVDPSRDGQYRWMQAQIDWSRIYMAGHVRSDITGGTLLGDMIGEYWARTRA